MVSACLRLKPPPGRSMAPGLWKGCTTLKRVVATLRAVRPWRRLMH